jgi:transcriptional regulator with XRE-family HTH domain
MDNINMNKKEKLIERKPLEDRLFQIRIALGLNQSEFAKSIRCTQPLISKIKKGEAYVTDKLIDAVCLWHNVNKVWFMTGEGDMFNSPRSSEFDNLSADETELILHFRDLEIQTKKDVFKYIDEKLELQKLRGKKSEQVIRESSVAPADSREPLPAGDFKEERSVG